MLSSKRYVGQLANTFLLAKMAENKMAAILTYFSIQIRYSYIYYVGIWSNTIFRHDKDMVNPKIYVEQLVNSFLCVKMAENKMAAKLTYFSLQICYSYHHFVDIWFNIFFNLLGYARSKKICWSPSK